MRVIQWITLFLTLLLLVTACNTVNLPGGKDNNDNGRKDPPPSAVVAGISALPASGTVSAPMPVTFNSLTSSGQVAESRWLIDGEEVASGSQFTYLFQKPGDYTISLQVTSLDGQQDEASFTYTLSPSEELLDAEHILTVENHDTYSFMLDVEGHWQLRGGRSWMTPEPWWGEGPTEITLPLVPEELPDFLAYTGASFTMTLHVRDGDNIYRDAGEMNVTFLRPLTQAPDKVDVTGQVGKTTSSGFRILNEGNYPLEVNPRLTGHNPGGIEATITTNDKPVNSDLAVIAPDSSTTFTVEATCPDTASTFTGSIHLDSNDPREPRKRLPITITCEEAPASQFNIELVFKEGAFTPEQERMMQAAARRWEEVIINDLPDRVGSNLNRYCLASISRGSYHNSADTPHSKWIAPELEGITHIDDLLVYVFPTTENMGESTLGRAGPCHDGINLPYTGRVMINPDKLPLMMEYNALTDVMVHELGHVLGIGTLWRYHNLAGPNPEHCHDPKHDPEQTRYYLAEHGNHEYINLGGHGSAPLDLQCAHWNLDHFQHEVLSPVLTLYRNGDGPVHSPISRVTLGSLADLGYTVDYSAADSYTLPGAYTTQSLGADSIQIEMAPPELLTPAGRE